MARRLWLVSLSGVIGAAALTGCNSGTTSSTSATSANTSAATTLPAPNNQSSKTADATDKSADARSTLQAVAENSAPAKADGVAASNAVENKASSSAIKADSPATPTAAKSSKAPEAATAAVQEPTTAHDAFKVINLENLPKFNAKQILDISPAYVYYSAEGTVADADKYYHDQLSKLGWQATKHLATSADQYVDRLMTKDGYYLRLSISSGSSRGEVGINIALLGNFDVQALPRTSDAEAQDSTAVMAGHRTALGIADAYDQLTAKMLQQGWQVVSDFHDSMPDVPHFKSIRFRKNAFRVNLGFSKDPVKPADKTYVFYHAENVMTFDVPTIDTKQPIKLDYISGRAAVAWRGSRSELVELVQKFGQTVGWKLLNAEEYISEKTLTLFVETDAAQTSSVDLPSVKSPDEKTQADNSSSDTPMGLAIRYVESGGNYSISIERGRLPKRSNAAEKPSIPEPEPVASSVPDTPTVNDSVAAQAKSELDNQFDQIETAMKDAVQKEIEKALGSIGQPPAKGQSQLADLKALQAKAAELQAAFGAATDDDDKQSGNLNNVQAETLPTQDIFNVPDDKEPLADEDKKLQKSRCVVKLGSQELQLSNCLAFARMEYDEPTKIVMFSDKPLIRAKLEQLFVAGESMSAFDAMGMGKDSAKSVLELKIGPRNVSLNFYSDGLSISTNSSDLRSTVRLKEGKVQGRVMLEKPMSVNDKDVTFTAEIAEMIYKVDGSVRKGDPLSISADSSYEFPLPLVVEGREIETSPYRSDISVTVKQSLADVTKFYRDEFKARGWKEASGSNGAHLSFQSPSSLATVELTREDNLTRIKMLVRNQAKAKSEGLLPQTGQGMIVLANLSDENVDVTLGKQQYKLPAGRGAKDPKDALRVPALPGTHVVQWKSASGKTDKETVAVVADSTWAAIYDKDFQQVMQVY